MKKLILTAALAVGIVMMSWRSDALTYAQFRAEKLLELSDVAAIIKITSGQLLACGAGYHGQVSEPIKGTFKKGDDINFGEYIGKSIGESYLVFLRAKPKTQAEYDAANPLGFTLVGPGAAAEMEWWKKRNAECFTASPPWTEMRGGTATLTVGHPVSLNGKEAVLFEEEWNLPPEGTRKKAWKEFDSGIVSEKRSWVSVDDVVDALRKKVANPSR